MEFHKIVFLSLFLVPLIVSEASRAANICEMLDEHHHQMISPDAQHTYLPDFQSEAFRSRHKLIDVVTTANDTATPFQAFIYHSDTEIAGSSTLVIAHGNIKLGTFSLQLKPKRMWFEQTSLEGGGPRLKVEMENGSVTTYLTMGYSNMNHGLGDYQRDQYQEQVKPSSDGSGQRELTINNKLPRQQQARVFGLDGSSGSYVSTGTQAEAPRMYWLNEVAETDGQGSKYEVINSDRQSIAYNAHPISIAKIPENMIVTGAPATVTGFAVSEKFVALVLNNNTIITWNLNRLNGSQATLDNLNRSLRTGDNDNPYTNVEIINGHVLLTKTQKGEVRFTDLAADTIKTLGKFNVEPDQRFSVSQTGIVWIIHSDGTAQIAKMTDAGFVMTKKLIDHQGRDIVSVSIDNPMQTKELLRKNEHYVTFGFKDGTIMVKKLVLGF
jgi:hypothetical protein